MPRDGKTSVGADHDPGRLREGQRMAPRRRAADLARLAPPDSVVAMARPDKGMGDFMKDGVADMVRFCVADIMARQGNGSRGVVALTGAPARVIQLYCPAVEAMVTHELGGCFQRRLERPVSWLHAVPAI